MTEPIQASITEAPFPDSRLLFRPKSGKIFATITFTGSCVFAGEEGVKGEVSLNAPNLVEELTEQRIEGLNTTENNSLEMDGAKAYLEGGKVQLGLTSDAKWSFIAPNDLAIRVLRLKGIAVSKNAKACLFEKTGETCEIKVEVAGAPAGVSLMLPYEALSKQKGEIAFKKIRTGTGTECTIGTVIGGRNSSCVLTIEYTGKENPNQGEYEAQYLSYALEVGGAEKETAVESLGLIAR